MKNSFIDVLLYMYSLSLIDVRCECLVLLKELSLYKDYIDRYDYVIEFMKDHLIPDDLYCYRNEIKPKLSIFSLNALTTKTNESTEVFKAPMVYCY